MKDEKRPDKMPHFIIHHSSFILFLRARLELARHNEEPVFIALETIPRRGLGEAVHLRFRVFLAVLGVLHHVGESHQRLVGAAHRVQIGIHRQLLAHRMAAGGSIKCIRRTPSACWRRSFRWACP